MSESPAISPETPALGDFVIDFGLIESISAEDAFMVTTSHRPNIWLKVKKVREGHKLCPATWRWLPIPEITSEHLEAFERHALGWMPFSKEGAAEYVRLRELYEVVRSLVSRSRELFDPRTEVKVERRTLEIIADSLQAAERSGMATEVRRWLSTTGNTP